jgi:hypothetical protein
MTKYKKLTFKNTIQINHLYGQETWSDVLREENRKKEQGIRKLCGPNRDKIQQELRKSHNQKSHDHTPGKVILKWIFQK